MSRLNLARAQAPNRIPNHWQAELQHKVTSEAELEAYLPLDAEERRALEEVTARRP